MYKIGYYAIVNHLLILKLVPETYILLFLEHLNKSSRLFFQFPRMIFIKFMILDKSHNDSKKIPHYFSFPHHILLSKTRHYLQ